MSNSSFIFVLDYKFWLVLVEGNKVNSLSQLKNAMIIQDLLQGVFFFLPSCEPRQCQPDFLLYFVEVCCFIQLKIHQKFKFAEIPRTFHLHNDKNKSNLLILLEYFVKFPVRQSIFCEQSSQLHGEKDGLIYSLIENSTFF